MSGFQGGLFDAVAYTERFVARRLEPPPRILPARHLTHTIAVMIRPHPGRSRSLPVALTFEGPASNALWFDT